MSVEAVLVQELARIGLEALVDVIAGLCDRRVVVLETEPISDDPIKRMDEARAAAAARTDSTPPPDAERP